jgi:hypothetical protein
VIFTACGTSWHAALSANIWLSSSRGSPAEVEYAAEFRYGHPIIDKHTLVVAISQSGETMDDFIADLAVGTGAHFLKAGSPSKPERMVKYKRLMEIEQELNKNKMNKLFLLRHFKSQWNLDDRFAGWVDNPLSEEGIKESENIAQEFVGFDMDVIYTSPLCLCQIEEYTY